jgi:hypothetical protein
MNQIQASTGLSRSIFLALILIGTKMAILLWSCVGFSHRRQRREKMGFAAICGDGGGFSIDAADGRHGGGRQVPGFNRNLERCG